MSAIASEVSMHKDLELMASKGLTAGKLPLEGQPVSGLLRKSGCDTLGFDAKPKMMANGLDCIEVIRIHPGGAVYIHNRDSTGDFRICPGDLIVGVNEQKGDAKYMLGEFKRGEEFNISILRQRQSCVDHADWEFVCEYGKLSRDHIQGQPLNADQFLSQASTALDSKYYGSVTSVTSRFSED
jgi:hypothetical protein